MQIRLTLFAGPGLCSVQARALVMLSALLCSLPAQTAERWFEPRHVQTGAPLFQQHCAQCHGAAAEGAPNWRAAGSDPQLAAPPLNGTGHAWHHPLKWLARTISEGGAGGMPAWKAVLSPGEILAVVAWFQSHWSDEIYAAWARMDAAARNET